MKITKTEFGPISQLELDEIGDALKATLPDAELELFRTCNKARETLTKSELDNIYVAARVTVEGTGTIQSVSPNCSVDQQDWVLYQDEPDLQIDAVYIDLETFFPNQPFTVSGSHSFIVVFKSEGNIWDCCKDLPEHVWNEGKFEFILAVDLTLEDGTEISGLGNYASKLITF